LRPRLTTMGMLARKGSKIQRNTHAKPVERVSLA